MNQNLWAPWRMKYIEKPAGSGNIFVELPAQNDDEKNFILYRGAHSFVMLNAYPYTNGHMLIAPLRQTNDLPTMTNEELLEINQLVAKAVGWLSEVFRPDGFNIGVNVGKAAGAGIPEHIHWHVLPRWNGDTNFMTTVGETRVMPQSLEDSYQKLLSVIQREP
jgi:ATP adenylyltransferase